MRWSGYRQGRRRWVFVSFFSTMMGSAEGISNKSPRRRVCGAARAGMEGATPALWNGELMVDRSL
jgi:hypothetical protein